MSKQSRVPKVTDKGILLECVVSVLGDHWQLKTGPQCGDKARLARGESIGKHQHFLAMVLGKLTTKRLKTKVILNIYPLQ